MAVKLQLRRDTSANWSAANPILAEGEIGIDTTLREAKVGDGSTAWNSLPYGLAQAAPGVRYDFSTTTTDADPGAGLFRLNNATAASATAAYFDNVDAFGTTVTAWLDALDDSTNTIKGYLRLQKQSDAAVFREYAVSGSVVDGTGYRKVTITHVVGNGSFSSGDRILVSFSRSGNVGADGYDPGYRFTFSTTTTDSDPGAGVLRANNATIGSVTQLYIDNADAGAASVTTWLDSLDDSTNTAHRGYLRLQKAGNPAIWAEFSVNGSVVDGTGYRKVPVAFVASNGSFASNDTLVLTFQRTGNVGASGSGTGDLLSTNNLSDLANAATARTNLGLGALATLGSVAAAQIDSNAVTTVKILDANVTTAKIADANVTTAKIADANVTTAKIADANVTTAKIADDNVTNAKLANMATQTIKGRTTAGTGDPEDLTVAQVRSLIASTEALTAARTYYVRTVPATITVTIASPGVVTWTSHGLSTNDPVVFYTTGALPTGITAGTVYYATVTGANTFTISSTVGGATINTTGSQSGTHTCSTGNDSNDGLTQSRSGAFMTIQGAINKVASINIGQYAVTIQLADGLYTTGATVNAPWTGTGTVTLLGNTGTPANVLISTTSANCITVSGGGRLVVSGMELRTTTSGSCLAAAAFSTLTLSTGIRFGAATGGYHLLADGGYITGNVAYTIAGGAVSHWIATSGGTIIYASTTVTLSGTPAFSTAFAESRGGAYIGTASLTFSGAATGPRYLANVNGAINTFGGGASYFPGNSAGSTATGGQYV